MAGTYTTNKELMDTALPVRLPVSVPFCRDCKWLGSLRDLGPIRPQLCLRPDRKILNMVDGEPILAENRQGVSAYADRTCVHPGACGREARFFEPKP